MNLKAFYTDEMIEAGCDEAGRGCIAGPVVAAAVILKKGSDYSELDDSKKLSEKKREILREMIINEALSYGVGIVSPQEIDEINILNASFLAMHRALDALSVRFNLILVDGNRFVPYHDISFKTIVGGDSKYQSIAASSILAKTTRDHLMTDYHKKYPHYNWAKNKGYPTLEHKNAVAQYGVSPLHRLTFNMSIQLKLWD